MCLFIILKKRKRKRKQNSYKVRKIKEKENKNCLCPKRPITCNPIQGSACWLTLRSLSHNNNFLSLGGINRRILEILAFFLNCKLLSSYLTFYWYFSVWIYLRYIVEMIYFHYQFSTNSILLSQNELLTYLWYLNLGCTLRGLEVI